MEPRFVPMRAVKPCLVATLAKAVVGAAPVRRSIYRVQRSVDGTNVVDIFANQPAMLEDLAHLLVSNNAPRAVSMGLAIIAARILATLASSCLHASAIMRVRQTSSAASQIPVFRARAHVRKVSLFSFPNGGCANYGNSSPLQTYLPIAAQ